jgi:flagellar motor switch protein FliM
VRPVSEHDPILSRDEVEALLSSRAPAQNRQVRLEPEPVDLLAGDRWLRQLIPLLIPGNARLSDALRKVFTSVLRTKVEVCDEPVEIVSGRGLTRLTAMAAALVVLRVQTPETRAHGVLAIDPTLTFTIIQRLFGGSLAGQTPPQRPPTNLERRMLLRALEPVIREMNGVLEPQGYFSFQVAGIEPRLDLVPGISADLTLVHVPLTLALGERFASMSLFLPSECVEPLRSRILPEVDSARAADLPRVLSRAPVTVAVELGTIEMTLRAVLELEVGQILRLDRHPNDELPVLVEGVPKFRALPVHDAGAVGIEITSRNQ